VKTAVGGRTAHAALVARQLDKPCIVGCAELAVDMDQHYAQFGQRTVRDGDWIAIDGGRGTIHLDCRQMCSIGRRRNWRKSTARAPPCRENVAADA
jgi:pyruvate,orthophosphate dikinase